MAWVDRFIDEIKEEVLKKKELMSARNSLKKSISGGEAYFSNKASNGGSAADLVKGTQRMLQLIDELNKIDNQITDIDIIIISKLEMYLGNFIGRVKIPERLNDAGDLIKHDCVYAVPFNSDDENLKEITPDDVWFLKMIKEAYKAVNVTFVDKDNF